MYHHILTVGYKVLIELVQKAQHDFQNTNNHPLAIYIYLLLTMNRSI